MEEDFLISTDTKQEIHKPSHLPLFNHFLFTTYSLILPGQTDNLCRRRSPQSREHLSPVNPRCFFFWRRLIHSRRNASTRGRYDRLSPAYQQRGAVCGADSVRRVRHRERVIGAGFTSQTVFFFFLISCASITVNPHTRVVCTRVVCGSKHNML